MDVRPHVGPDGEEFLTRQQAAQVAGVAPNTINTWEARGHLDRVAGCPRRHPLYRLADVIEAEFQARQAAVRTSGSETRTVRHYPPGGR